jgi:integrase
VLRAALADAVRWGPVVRNAAALAHGPRINRPELRVLSPEDAKAFLEVLSGERLEAFFTLAVASGLRLGELLGLRWTDVDLGTGSVRVRQALQRVDKKLQFVEPKSERSRRVVNLPTFVIKALKRHKML